MAQGQFGTVLQYLRRLIAPSAPSELSDGQLLDRFASRRDEDAFAALVQRHGPLVVGVCRRLLRDAHAIDDAFQAVFLVLVRRAGQIDRHRPLGPWLYGVAWRVARRARSTALRTQSRERPMDHLPPLSADVTESGELRAVLDEELRHLPEKHRALLVLHYLQGQTHEQTAQALGYPLGSMAWRLDQAREQLRRRLTRRGVQHVSGGVLGSALAAEAVAAPVPALLAQSTLTAALRFAATSEAAGVFSAGAASLAQGVLQEMFLLKLKIAALVLLVVGTVGLGAGFVGRQVLAGKAGAEDLALATPVPEKKPREGSSEPPDVPLQLRLIATQARYPLDLGGKTEEAYRQQVLGADTFKDCPAGPAVELGLELKNLGERDLELGTLFIRGGPGDPWGDTLGLTLTGPGVFVRDRKFPDLRASISNTDRLQVTQLAPGKSLTWKLQTLSDVSPIEGKEVATGLHTGITGVNPKPRKMLYWTKPGDYTLTARLQVAIAPPPQDAPAVGRHMIVDGKGRKLKAGWVILNSNPVKLTVGAGDKPPQNAKAPAGADLALATPGPKKKPQTWSFQNPLLLSADILSGRKPATAMLPTGFCWCGNTPVLGVMNRLQYTLWTEGRDGLWKSVKTIDKIFFPSAPIALGTDVGFLGLVGEDLRNPGGYNLATSFHRISLGQGESFSREIHPAIKGRVTVSGFSVWQDELSVFLLKEPAPGAVKGGGIQNEIVLVRSSDGGKSWGKPAKIADTAMHEDYSRLPVLQWSADNLGRFVFEHEKHQGWFLETADGGKSWSKKEVQLTDELGDGANRLPLAACRQGPDVVVAYLAVNPKLNDKGGYYVSRWVDRKTWTKGTLIDEQQRSDFSFIVNLAEAGQRLAFTFISYNREQRKPENRLMLSEDGGKSWSRAPLHKYYRGTSMFSTVSASPRGDRLLYAAAFLEDPRKDDTPAFLVVQEYAPKEEPPAALSAAQKAEVLALIEKSKADDVAVRESALQKLSTFGVAAKDEVNAALKQIEAVFPSLAGFRVFPWVE